MIPPGRGEVPTAIPDSVFFLCSILLDLSSEMYQKGLLPASTRVQIPKSVATKLADIRSTCDPSGGRMLNAFGSRAKFQTRTMPDLAMTSWR
jgi:hypothetical protein